VLAPLQELTGREPLHERAHARLMIALAGSRPPRCGSMRRCDVVSMSS
jgi:hypothetical protein